MHDPLLALVLLVTSAVPMDVLAAEHDAMAAPALANATALPSRLSLAPPEAPASPSEARESGALPTEIPATPSAPITKRFGAMDSVRFNVLTGYANDFDDASQASAGIGVSWFFVDDLSLDIELLGAGIFQPGPDAAAFNASLLVRWHFVARETWSLFADAGAGILLATEEVPQGGTPINFAPQLGVGVSFDVGDEARLLVGLRWSHISNARASKENPGRDSLLLTLGLSLPF